MLQFSPSGELLREILLPTAQVTSVSFGGPALDELYITTGREDVSAEDRHLLRHAFSGQLFKVTGLGAHGVPAQEFVPSLAAWDAAIASSTESVVVASTTQLFEVAPVGDDWIAAFIAASKAL